MEIAKLNHCAQLPIDGVVTVDSMLGWLARWLRILGVNTIYSPGLNDNELRIVEGIVVTRDRGLCYSRRGLCLLLSSSNHTHWLCAVALVLNLELRISDRSLCPLCGSRLVDTDHDARAPQWARRLKICVGCGKLYWEGSHHRRIKEILEETSRLLRRVRTRCVGGELKIILEDYGDYPG